MSMKTRNRILNAAERLFAENGYDATSIRRITTEAEVSLPAVHYHFTSKEALYRECVEQCLTPLDQARLRALDELETRSRPNPPSVEALVRVLVESALAQASDPDHGKIWLRFVSRIRSEKGDHWRQSLLGFDQHMEMFNRYVQAFQRALPALSQEELKLRLFFMTCTIANAMIDNLTLPLLGTDIRSIHEIPEVAGACLINYVLAGLVMTVDRKTDSRTAQSEHLR